MFVAVLESSLLTGVLYLFSIALNQTDSERILRANVHKYDSVLRAEPSDRMLKYEVCVMYALCF